MLDELFVPKGRKVNLSRIATDAKLGLKDKESARADLVDIQNDIRDLHIKLHAEGRNGVLVVLQAMDTGGKDGAARCLSAALAPAAMRLASFKVPAGRERQQDYLWRVHAEMPRKGELVIFNRSHYEDVLVVRVRELVPPEVWKRRYAHIAAFENMLADEGTQIIKIMLHISKEENRIRQQERIDLPEKNWKFRAGDLDDRLRWDDFMAAYQDAIAKTSTERTPWYIVPADRKWVRDVAVATIVRHHLQQINPQFPVNPEVTPGLKVV